MEACLNFSSNNRKNHSDQFEFSGKSGSQWTLFKNWSALEEDLYEVCINIQKTTSGIHRSYFADVEVFPEYGDTRLKSSAKGTWNEIKVYIQEKELLTALYGSKCENERKMYTEKFWDTTVLQYKIQLFPVLELQSAEQFNRDKQLVQEGRQTLVHDIGSLFNNPKFDFLNDIVVVSGIFAVEAHKNVLSVRLPEFRAIFNGLLDHREEDDMDVAELPDCIGPVLCEMVRFLYTTEYPTRELSMVYLCIASEEMGVEILQKILHEYAEIWTPETAVYILHLTERHGMQKLHEKSMAFLLDNFERIVSTPAWNSLENSFACLREARIKEGLAAPVSFDGLEILKLSLQKASKAMIAEFLAEEFLQQYMAALTPESALYVIYQTQFHGIEKFHTKALDFLLKNFEQIKRSDAWNLHEIYFACLSRASRRLAKPGQFSQLQILELSLYMVSKTYYTIRF